MRPAVAQSAARSALTNLMARAAVRASRPLQRDFGEIENLLASREGAGAFAAHAAARVRDGIARELARARGDYRVLAPEDDDPGGPAWLVAPLDGLANLAHGIPHAAVALGARARVGDGAVRLAAAVVFDPFRNELYWAEAGVGAYVDRRRIRGADPADLDAAVIALAPPEGLSQARLTAAASPAAVRVTGCAALDIAWVAAGRFDGFAGAEPKAAPGIGALLLREAGVLTDSAALPGGGALTLAAKGRLLARLADRAAGLARP